MSLFGNFSFLSHTLQIPIITISVEASKYKSMISVENYVFLPLKMTFKVKSIWSGKCVMGDDFLRCGKRVQDRN